MEIPFGVWSTWEPGELEARVSAFAEALIAHRDTVDVPAPAEHPLIEQIVRAGGMDAVMLLPAPPPPTEIPVETMTAAQLHELIARVSARLDQITGA